MNTIRAIIGLGNPGSKFTYTRHNIGFRIVDELAKRYGGIWREKDNMEFSEIRIDDHPVLLIKPQTFMNSSGQVVPFLTKKGIKPEEILVVHDELELPFGSVKHKVGGSHKGHNGLRSIADAIGREFQRIRYGIGRPEIKEQVGDYVLEKFSVDIGEVEVYIDQAIEMIESLFGVSI